MSPYLIQQTVGRGKPNWVHLLSLLKSIQQRKWKSVFGCEKCMSVHELCWQQIKKKKKKRDNTTLTRWTGSFSNRVNWRSVKSLHVQTQSWGKYGCFQWNAVFFLKTRRGVEARERSALAVWSARNTMWLFPPLPQLASECCGWQTGLWLAAAFVSKGFSKVFYAAATTHFRAIMR